MASGSFEVEGKESLKQKRETSAQYVLVVEDDYTSAKISQLLIQRLGFPALVARTAEEAVRICNSEPPSLIITDVGLPDMNGLQLVKEIREISSCSRIPVVAVTAHAGEAVREEAMRVGCNFFIPKPFRTHEFIDKIRAFLPKGGA